MFQVLGYYAPKIDLSKVLKTNHCKDERELRENFVKENLNDYTVRKTFVVDKAHKNGLELHCITESGLIVVLNKWKYENHRPCHITTLIARPGQIKRYYKDGNAPQDILDLCFKNRQSAVEGDIY